jgi:hypothetical protein
MKPIASSTDTGTDNQPTQGIQHLAGLILPAYPLSNDRTILCLQADPRLPGMDIMAIVLQNDSGHLSCWLICDQNIRLPLKGA